MKKANDREQREFDKIVKKLTDEFLKGIEEEIKSHAAKENGREEQRKKFKEYIEDRLEDYD